MTIRVVLDANVFVSAAIQRGASSRIVQRWLTGDAFELIVGEGVLAEVEGVLTRPRLTKRISVDDALSYVRAIRTLADVVEDAVVIESLTRDSDDDYIVALAREHGAAVVVSGDKDLLEWAGATSAGGHSSDVRAGGVGRAQIALAWVLSRPAVASPIVGATRLTHLDDAIAAVDLPLDEHEIRRLEQHYVPHAVEGFA